VDSFLSAVVQKYANNSTKIIRNNNSSKKIYSNGKNKKKQGKNGGSKNKRVKKMIRKFSKDNVLQMLAEGRNQQQYLKIRGDKPSSRSITWRRLRGLLRAGTKGPNLARSGIGRFVRSSFPRSLKLYRGAMKKRKINARSIQDDNMIETFSIPLSGLERAEEYKTNVCQYILNNNTKYRLDCANWEKVRRAKLKSRRKKKGKGGNKKKKGGKKKAKGRKKTKMSGQNPMVNAFLTNLVQHSKAKGHNPTIINP